jgi:hypothetical protein
MARTWSCETSEVGLPGEVAGTTLKEANSRYHLLARNTFSASRADRKSRMNRRLNYLFIGNSLWRQQLQACP